MKKNYFIKCCDNLDLLKTLPDKCIDLMYNDLLYATGRTFSDYQDLKAEKSIVDEFYIPRLKEMHRVLKDTGSIYLQMDLKINHWIRILMDDIFGYQNFKNEIIWKRSNGINHTKNNYLKIDDRILYYTKSNKYTFNIQYVPLSESGGHRYNKTDENGELYMLMTLVTKKNNKPSNKQRVINGKTYTAKEGMGFDWTQDYINKKIKEGIIIEENTEGTPCYRRYLKDSQGAKLNNIWTDIGFITSTNTYDTQKPEELLERIIKVSSNQSDTVADFFAGSHTTGAVALNLGRKYVGCDINPASYEIGLKRLTGALKKDEK